jgi:hypothetical protein
MGAWVHGCVGAWVRGCMGAWVRACERAWVRACVRGCVRACVRACFVWYGLLVSLLNCDLAFWCLLNLHWIASPVLAPQQACLGVCRGHSGRAGWWTIQRKRGCDQDPLLATTMPVYNVRLVVVVPWGFTDSQCRMCVQQQHKHKHKGCVCSSNTTGYLTTIKLRIQASERGLWSLAVVVCCLFHSNSQSESDSDSTISHTHSHAHAHMLAQRITAVIFETEAVR